MRKKCLLLSILLLLPLSVKANIICNDGTPSATCTDCHTGCCSRHGGCTDSPNNGGGGGYSQSNDGYQQQNNYYSEPQPVPEPNTPIENNTDSSLEESSNNEVEETIDNDESDYVESNDESNDSEITNHNDTSDSDDTGSGIVGLGVLGGLGYLFFKKKSKR